MNEYKQGDKVHYDPSHGRKENGFVKSKAPDIGSGDAYFVVYHWADDPENFMNYTGARTNIRDLRPGWVDENGEPLKEETGILWQLD